MNKDSYIGIENEFVKFDKDGLTRKSYDSGDIDRLSNSFRTTFYKSRHSIRTDAGLGYYVDGDEMEVCTPPIAINKGFSTRLTDILLFGRDKIINSFAPDQTGYSMHWNLSNFQPVSSGDFWKQVAVPFRLMASTPLSVGVGMREKVGRYEMLGDSLNEIDQINAASLLFGAYRMTRGSGKNFPIDIGMHSNRLPASYRLEDGRYSYINIFDGESWKEMQAQEILEKFYYWLSPAIKQLGTKKEVKNLSLFISGDKSLEFDNFIYYSNLKMNEKKINGIYLPHSLSISESQKADFIN